PSLRSFPTRRSSDLIHLGLLPVIKSLMTTAANPVPIKSVLNAMGFAAGPFRLPLVPLTDEQLQSVMSTVKAAGDLITFKTGVKRSEEHTSELQSLAY